MKSEAAYQMTRRYQRFNANHRALVLLQDDKDYLPYHIVQIGKGGLSFRYLGKKLSPSEISKISIYQEDQLIVDSIPVKPVSDFRLRDNLVPVRCGSVCFEELDKEQVQKLSEFIQNYTISSDEAKAG